MKLYATTNINIKLQLECALGAEVLYMAVACLDMINRASATKPFNYK